MNIIIPLCGIGDRFLKAGYKQPKPLIDVFEKKMIHHVLDSLVLEENDTIFIVYHTSLDAYNFRDIVDYDTSHTNIHYIPINYRTQGAAETVLFGIQYILQNKLSTHKQTLLIDCDTIYNIDILQKFRKKDKNAVLCFEDNDNKPIYSYITMDENNIILDIKEKEKISMYANTGAYYFTDIYNLQTYCQRITNDGIKFKNEYYISCVISTMIHEGFHFEGIQIDKKQYISLGTPEELESYKNYRFHFLFDLDGTLVKTEGIYYKVWEEICQQFQIVLTPEIYQKYISGNNDMTTMKKLQINSENYKIHEISDQKDQLFKKYIDEIYVIEGVQPFLKQIKELGHKVCIVTNCNRSVCEEILEYIQIRPMIDFIVIGNECEHPKPYPDPYNKAIELCCTSKEKCIIFEDSKPGFLSAKSVGPRNIIGIQNGENTEVLEELQIETIVPNFMNIDLHTIITKQDDIYKEIEECIYRSLKNKYYIFSVNIDRSKLKGGYISDVIRVSIETYEAGVLDCVLKYENNYTTSLTKMAYKLGLFDREYYFYETIRDYMNINVPKYIGTIKDSNFISKGILLENIKQPNYHLNLDLNKENIDVSLKVIEECAKFHSLFWNKDLSRAFQNLKKHNDPMFCPVWENFIKERWPHFTEKWKHVIKQDTMKKMETIVHNFSKIQDDLSHTNLTLCHGDVKSGNIFYKKEGLSYTPYFIDWQYIAHGKGVQDIVFFMIESFTVENIKQYSELFKSYYYIKLKENNIVNYTWEEYLRDFKNAVCYFPFFVAIWFGTTPEDELIDVSFPFLFIQKFVYFLENMF